MNDAPHPRRLILSEVVTPIGALLCVADDSGMLRVADWADCPDRFARLLHRHCRVMPRDLADRDPLPPLRWALGAYFAGHIAMLGEVPVLLGGTKFQHQVWSILRSLPAGETITYAELARRAGRPNAGRAAGVANGANPISVVVPCHRAIGSNGDLTGYAGGLARKRWLLAHERAASAA